MKKKNIFIFGLVCLTSLTACNDEFHPDTSIKVWQNYDVVASGETQYTMFEKTYNDVMNLIKDKCSFPLLYYSKDCPTCDTAMENLENYLKATGSYLYKLEYTRVAQYELNRKYPSIFTSSIDTPSLLIIKEGELSYIIHANKLTSYSNVRYLMGQYFYFDNMYTAYTSEGIQKFYDDHDDYLGFVNIVGSNSSRSLYGRRIQNFTARDVFVINMEELPVDGINTLSMCYGFNEVATVGFYVKDKQVQWLTNYEKDYEDKFLNYLNELSQQD